MTPTACSRTESDGREELQLVGAGKNNEREFEMQSGAGILKRHRGIYFLPVFPFHGRRARGSLLARYESESDGRANRANGGHWDEDLRGRRNLSTSI